MNLILITLFFSLGSSALLMLSASLPLQALALLVISGAIACILGTNISILLGIYTILIYSSGLLVLLAYFVALSPNQTLNTPSRSTSFIMSAAIFVIIGQTFLNSNISHISDPADGVYSVVTILTPASGSLLVIIALTLVLTIIAVVNVSSLSSGPIRPWSIN